MNYPIEFSDNAVKTICVSNWDTNGDSELSYGEAAAVTNLGKVFSKNKTITSFDELQYFTGLEEIPSQAFFNCTALTSVTIPVNVAEIGQNALSGCSSLASINVDADNPNMSSVDGVLFGFDNLELIQYPIAKGNEYAVPEGTMTIGRDAFYKSTINSVTLPSSLTELDFDAFGYCKNLTEISLPDGLEEIGGYAFDHCTGLTSMTIPSSVTSIGSKAFNYCTSLTTVSCLWTENPTAIPDDAFPASVYESTVLRVPEGMRLLYKAAAGWSNFNRIVEEGNQYIEFADPVVKAICVENWDTDGDGELSLTEAAAVTDLGDVFKENGEITSFDELQYFTGLTDLGDALETCPSLESVIIPSGVESMDSWSNLSSLSRVQVDGNNPWLDSRNDCNGVIETATNTLILGCQTTVIPDDVTAIRELAFGGRWAMQEMTIPSSVTSIGVWAFSYCISMTHIEIPASVTEIGGEAFTNSALGCVTVEWDEPLSVPEDIFRDIDLSKATLIVPVGTKAAYETAAVWSNFGNIVEDPNIVFEDLTVKQICVTNWDTDGDGELSYVEAARVDEWMFGETFRGTNITQFTELQYFKGLGWIPDNAFNGCKILAKVVIPTRVDGIGISAFYGCYKLTSVEMSEGCLENIMENAFYACSALPEVKIPNSVKNIHDKAFYYCRKLVSVELPASLNYMGKSVFAACPLLRDVTANMPEPVTITSNVFPSVAYTEGTLTVRAGKAPLYQAADYWKNFSNIVEKSVVIAGGGSVHKGGIGYLDIRMDNTEGIVAYQTEVQLPEGFGVEYMELNGDNGHTVSYNDVGDNNYRITVFSLNNGELLPIEDNIMLRIRIQAPAEAECTVTATARNNVVVDGAGTRITFNDFLMDIDVLDNRMGDVNGDDVVDVVDVVNINNHIMGYEPSNFVADVADMNADGIIDVADIVQVVTLILSEQSDPLVIGAPVANAVKVTLTNGETVSLNAETAGDYCAVQVDLTLNEGMTLRGVTADASHAVAFRQTGRNCYRIIAYSASNSAFSSHEALLSLDVEGEGTVRVSGGLLATADGEGYRIAAAEGQATGISGIAADTSQPTEVYTISGQRVTTSLKDMPAGIYIINGKKMVVK